MNNIFNPDFKEFIHALNKANVRYILVGGYSVIIHGYNRTTGDMDIWIEQTASNYDRLVEAFKYFGMPVFDMTKERFLSNDMDVFSFGRPPVSIDIMTQVKGLEFDETYNNSEIHTIDNTSVRVINLQFLRRAKKAVNRPKDQDDLLNLPEEE